MDDKEIRMRIVEAIAPIASRAEIDTPEKLIERCKTIESYVKGNANRSRKRNTVKPDGNESNKS